LNQLKFCEAVIKEVLRLHPIATSTVGRTCTKLTTLNSIPIDPGTIILVDLFELHTDKNLWGNKADEFIPERWLSGNLPINAYYPFGMGRRSCMGFKLAYIELKLALIEIVRNFKIIPTQSMGVSFNALI
jgi:cytochrome P450 family 13